MNNTTQKFVDAFGSPKRKDVRYSTDYNANEGFRGYDDKQRGDAFEAAFTQPKSENLPTAHKGQSFRWDNTKIAKLSFSEKFGLGDLEGMSYRDLPAWVRDGGYAIPSYEEQKYQRDTQRETGFSQTERNQILDQFALDLEIFNSMAANPILRDTASLDAELARYTAKHGNEFIAGLGEAFPETAAYLKDRQEVKAAEQRALEERQHGDTAAEIQEAAQKLGINLDELKADAAARNEEVDG